MEKVLYFMLIACLFYACTSNPSENSTVNNTGDTSFNISQVRQSIEASNKQFSDAVLKGDSAKLVSLYHSDAEVYPPGMPKDKSTLMGSLAATGPKMGLKTFTLNTTAVAGNAEEITEIGTYEFKDSVKTIEKGKYIVIWKPQNGQWKMWRDIWNSDNPPAPATNSR